MKTYSLQLDLQMFAQEKTESATPKKRQESRKKGQVAKSMELPGAFILFFTFLYLYMFGGMMKDSVFSLFTDVFQNYLLQEVTTGNIFAFFSKMIYRGAMILAPIMLITVIVAIIGNFVQVGIMFTGDPLLMNFGKLNPIEGAKKIFSLKSVAEFLKSILKLLIVGVIAYLTLWNNKGAILSLANVPLEGIMGYTARVAMVLGLKIGIILVVLALVDYIYQRYEYEKSIKMSKQDIKDEYKKSEGDPVIKSRIRERQRKMALQRMMQEVPKADVVITNPTHYAIAIQYDAKKMQAPTVLAKGQDFIALKIKQIAQENGIITMENKPLARALFDQVDVGESISSELFQAVAEVLAYVYKIKGKAK